VAAFWWVLVKARQRTADSGQRTADNRSFAKTAAETLLWKDCYGNAAVEKLLWKDRCEKAPVEKLLWKDCCEKAPVERLLRKSFCGTGLVEGLLRKSDAVGGALRRGRHQRNLRGIKGICEESSMTGLYETTL
jgi:hypothetical protein